MTKLWRQCLCFLSACLPLFTLNLILEIFGNTQKVYLSWFTSRFPTIAKMITANQASLALTLLLLGLGVYGTIWMIQRSKGDGQSYYLKSVAKNESKVWPVVSGTWVAFAALLYNGIGPTNILSAFTFGFLFLLYVQSDSVLINPTLALLGLKYYEAETDQGVKIRILAKDGLLNESRTNLVRVFEDSFEFVEKDVKFRSRQREIEVTSPPSAAPAPTSRPSSDQSAS